MVAPGKSILAADESSTGTIQKTLRCDRRPRNSEDNRRDYREMPCSGADKDHARA